MLFDSWGSFGRPLGSLWGRLRASWQPRGNLFGPLEGLFGPPGASPALHAAAEGQALSLAKCCLLPCAYTHIVPHIVTHIRACLSGSVVSSAVFRRVWGSSCGSSRRFGVHPGAFEVHRQFKGVFFKHVHLSIVLKRMLGSRVILGSVLGRV